MKKITSSFVISNIISSVALIASIPILKQQNSDWFKGVDKVGGIVVFFILAAGHYACYYKAKVLSSNSYRYSLNKLEKSFLGIIFFFGVTSVMFTMMSISSLFEDYDEAPTFMKVILVVLVIVLMVFLVLEASIVFGTLDAKPKEENKVINILLYLYVSTGIAVGWDVFIIGSNLRLNVGQSDLITELIAVIVLAIMLFLPFQRIFWYEIMAESKGWKDNLIVLGSLLLVLASAIIPLFFK